MLALLMVTHAMCFRSSKGAVHQSRLPGSKPGVRMPAMDSSWLNDCPHGFADLADTVITAGTQRLPCHSQLLSFHSPVFAHCIALQQHGSLEVPVDEPADTIGLLLKHIYAQATGREVEVSITLIQASALARAAHKYEVRALLPSCDARLAALLPSQLNRNNCADALDWLLLADRCQLPKTVALCQAFVVRHFQELISDPRMYMLTGSAWVGIAYALHLADSTDKCGLRCKTCGKLLKRYISGELKCNTAKHGREKLAGSACMNPSSPPTSAHLEKWYSAYLSDQSTKLKPSAT